MSNKNMAICIVIGMVLGNNCAHASHADNEQLWNPWASKDFYAEVMQGQHDLKQEQQLQIDQDSQIAERNMMKQEERYEFLRLQKQAQEDRKKMQKNKSCIEKLRAEMQHVQTKIVEQEDLLALQQAHQDNQFAVIRRVESKKKDLLKQYLSQEHRYIKEHVAPQLHKPSSLHNQSDIRLSPDQVNQVKRAYIEAFTMGAELMSRKLTPTCFYTGNIFWPWFFLNCHNMIDAYCIEINHGIQTVALQRDIQRFMEHDDCLLQNEFKKNVRCGLPQKVIDVIHERLSVITNKEKQLYGAVLAKKAPFDVWTIVNKQGEEKESKAYKQLKDIVLYNCQTFSGMVKFVNNSMQTEHTL